MMNVLPTDSIRHMRSFVELESNEQTKGKVKRNTVQKDWVPCRHCGTGDGQHATPRRSAARDAEEIGGTRR